MAKTKNDNKNVIINQTLITQVKRDSLDIGKWKSALKAAESLTNPNRTNLYDIYSNVLVDSHLMAVMQKRKLPILNSKLQLNTENEAMKEMVEKYTNTTEFKKMLSHILDAIFWGHSLIEVIPKDIETLAFDYVLIPRKNVRPIQKIVVKNPTDTTGIPYDTGEYNLIEVGDSDDLGLLNSACPYLIYKRNGFADFAQYTEIFGQPIREGTYDGYDENARLALKRDLEEAGSSQIFIHPEGTKLELKEATNKTGSSDLYKTLIQQCNGEVSKLILGNTLTTEVGDSGGNRALGEVMYEAEKQFIEADKSKALNVLNAQYLKLLQNLGIQIDGEFAFVEQINLKDRIDLDIKINSVAPIDPKYFADTYGVPLRTDVKIDTANPKEPKSTKEEKAKAEKKNPLYKALEYIFSQQPSEYD